MKITSVIVMFAGACFIARELIKIYCIFFLKRPYKAIDGSFDFCFRSVLYYLVYSILGISLGMIFLMYGYMRFSYDNQILSEVMMMLYLIILGFWIVFRSKEEMIKRKYFLSK